MEQDDVMRGRLLSRRELLALMGAAGLALLTACADDGGGGEATASRTSGAGAAAATPGGTRAAAAARTTAPSCVVSPAMMEGPFFVDGRLLRSDIRSDPAGGITRDGVPLDLTLVVSSVGGDGACAPIERAVVDIWQCDADGVYSGVDDPASGSTLGEQWLRGQQVTGADGAVRFTTIYPGWYPGRATHIHFKVRAQQGGETGAEFTSQLYFDDALSDTVHASGGAYAPRGATGRVRNADDGIYRDGGDQLLLDVTPSGSGYASTFHIGMLL